MIAFVLILSIVWLMVAVWRLLAYRQHVVAYARGMVAYRTNNWKGRTEAWSMAAATYDEFIELIEAIIACDLCEAFAELCDVTHGIVNTIALLLLGSWMKNTVVYQFLYELCPLTAWKHGDRYLKYGCVRSLNHHNEDGSAKKHVCSGDKEKIANLKLCLTNI